MEPKIKLNTIAYRFVKTLVKDCLKIWKIVAEIEANNTIRISEKRIDKKRVSQNIGNIDRTLNLK